MQGESSVGQVNIEELAKRAGGKMWYVKLRKFGYNVNPKQVEVKLAMAIMDVLRQRGFVCSYDRSFKVPVVYATCNDMTFAIIVRLYFHANPYWAVRIKNTTNSKAVVLVKHEAISSILMMERVASLGIGYFEYILSAKDVIAMVFDESKIRDVATNIAEWLSERCRQ